MTLPVPVIRVGGTPAECGAAYGAAAAAPIRANMALYLRRFADQAGLDEAAVAGRGARYRATTRALHPRVAQLLDAMAESAGIGVEHAYALNARTELLYDARVDAARVRARLEEASPEKASPEPDGCTALGVLGTHTATGHLLLAQNWDWHPDQTDATLLLHTRDESGHEVLTLAEAGMLAKTGLNSAGVGVCLNMLGTDRDGMPAEGPAGVPYHVLVRAALEARHLAGALRTVCRSPRNASLNLVLGQAGSGPAEGELIDVELIPGDVGWLHPVDGVVTHANHLEAALPAYDTIKDWGGSSLFRSVRARRLLASAAAATKVTEDDLAGVLRDHASYPHAICRHVDPLDAEADRSQTVYAVLLDLDERRFGIAAGPPCGHDFEYLTLG
ncbi:C45 family autoproteolytic acyltransferase/hydolase [Rhizomonospora bruguierae]|uniref:C45 family autoproteolytic acyltransferase/hydolase n=1 Tax=Rhizomonospora bruguierae TaxID=1581705 RepID=UPI001BCBA5E9|nr:C45 family peptidase [Micromonospora sp. NBRC 107566]